VRNCHYNSVSHSSIKLPNRIEYENCDIFMDRVVHAQSTHDLVIGGNLSTNGPVDFEQVDNKSDIYAKAQLETIISHG